MGDPVSTAAFEAARARLAGRFDAAVFDPWWDALPALIAQMADRWALALGEPVGHGETAVVLPAARRESGDRVFLKLTPDLGLCAAEARALEAWAPTGRVPRVLERDGARGAMLLAAVPAEQTVREAGGVPSLASVAALVRELHRVPPEAGAFEPLAGRAAFLFDLWDRRLGRGGDSRGAPPGRAADVGGGPGLLDRGRRLAADLATDGPASVLLHGDLHPGNVFDVGGEVGLMAIDPRPCIGDPGFDLIDWILRGSDDPTVWRARASELAALVGADANRTWAWCEAFAAMLAAIEGARRGSARRVAALLEIAA